MAATFIPPVVRSLGLLLALLGLIGLVAFILTGRFSGPNQSATVSPAPATSITAPTSFAVDAWKIKVPLTDDISDVYIVVDPADSNHLWLSLSSLKTTNCAADKISLGGYQRFMENDIDGQTAHTFISEYPSASKVDNYYYTYLKPVQTCGDAADGPKAVAASASLAAAINTVIPVNKIWKQVEDCRVLIVVNIAFMLY